jgi:hypothetical protein
MAMSEKFLFWFKNDSNLNSEAGIEGRALHESTTSLCIFQYFTKLFSKTAIVIVVVVVVIMVLVVVVFIVVVVDMHIIVIFFTVSIFANTLVQAMLRCLVILLHSLYRRWRKRISSLIFCRWITYA